MRSATGRSTRCSRPWTRRSSPVRLAPVLDRLRDQGRVRGRRRPGPGAGALPPLVDEGPGALIVSGHGLSTNIIEASIEGYLIAINKLHGATTGVRSHSSAVGPPRSCRAETGLAATPGAADGSGTADVPDRVVPGDGVGPEVIAAAVTSSTPSATGGFDFEWLELTLGGAAIDAYGTACGART